MRGGRLTGGQGSGILTSMVKADALLVLPEGKKTAEPGETLRAIMLDDPQHVEDYTVTFSLGRYSHQPIAAFGDLNGDGRAAVPLLRDIGG